jgi:predicted nucleotidyltransferase
MAATGSLPDHLALAETDRQQIDEVVAILQSILGPNLIGGYLFGSATMGGLKARSDIDVLAVSSRRLTRREKDWIVRHLFKASGSDPATVPPRPIELTIVASSDVRPGRYPPVRDLQYGEWLRDAFERGDLEPWLPKSDPDVTLLITMVLDDGIGLAGPPPSDVFDRVPDAELVEALVADLPADIYQDTGNVALTLARVWNGVLTRTLCSKEEAAAWALPRLSSAQGAVLARARDIYLGAVPEHWEDLQDGLQPFLAAVTDEIEAAHSAFIASPRRDTP